jgi:hypothetical protein
MSETNPTAPSGAVDKVAGKSAAGALLGRPALKANERAVKARGKALGLDGAVQAKRSARRAR